MVRQIIEDEPCCIVIEMAHDIDMEEIFKGTPLDRP